MGSRNPLLVLAPRETEVAAVAAEGGGHMGRGRWSVLKARRLAQRGKPAGLVGWAL